MMIETPLKYEKTVVQEIEYLADQYYPSSLSSSSSGTQYVDTNSSSTDNTTEYYYKNYYFPYQSEVYSSFISTNYTVLYPQKEGFQVAAKFSDDTTFNRSQVFFDFLLYTKYENGTVTNITLESETCTSSHFSRSSNYTSERTMSMVKQSPVDGIQINKYMCPKRSDIGFYGNSQGVKSQYLEVIVLICNVNTTTGCVSTTEMNKNYAYSNVELLYIDNDITNYGNIVRTAVTTFKVGAYTALRNDLVFELVPNYVDPKNSFGPYTFYKVNFKYGFQGGYMNSERARFRFELSNHYIQSWKGQIFVEQVDRGLSTLPSSYIFENSSVSIMPDSYYALFVLSQLGGLMYLLTCIFGPLLGYVNSKISKHDLVNSWIITHQVRALQSNYQEHMKNHNEEHNGNTPGSKRNKNLLKSTHGKNADESYEEDKELVNDHNDNDSEQNSADKESASQSHSMRNQLLHEYEQKYQDIMKFPRFTSSDLLYDIF